MKRFFLYFCPAILVLFGSSYLVWQHLRSKGPSVAQEPTPSFQSKGQDGLTSIDLTPRPLDQIPVGAVIGQSPPKGWSHLVLMAIPTLVPEDERDAPKIATYYARMFKFTLLANVVPDKAPFRLEKVARGFATTVRGMERIVTGRDTLQNELNVLSRKILEENEKILDNDVKQIARTRTMLVFDAKSVMLRGKDHVHMIMRHAILVDPTTGRLYTLIWLLTNDYEPAEDVLQLIPDSMWEKRLLSIKRDKITLGIPTREAFALRRVPPGTPVPYTPAL